MPIGVNPDGSPVVWNHTETGRAVRSVGQADYERLNGGPSLPADAVAPLDTVAPLDAVPVGAFDGIDGDFLPIDGFGASFVPEKGL